MSDIAPVLSRRPSPSQGGNAASPEQLLLALLQRMSAARTGSSAGGTLLRADGIPTLAGASLVSLLLAGCAGGGRGPVGGLAVGGSGSSGIAADGYLAGATVFRDENRNGALDAGEATVTTDNAGRFSGLGGTESRPIGVTGGIDASTGLKFDRILVAPAGATVINPLTTLLQSFVDARGGTLAAAQATIIAKLGLPAGIDLGSFDPIAAAQSSVPATRADGLKAQAIAAQIANLLFTGALAAGGAIDTQAALIATNLANALATSAGTVNLASAAFLATVLPGAVSASVTASIASANNVNLASPPTLAQLAQAQVELQLANGLSISGATGASGTFRIGDTVTADFAPGSGITLTSMTVDFSTFGGGSAVAATKGANGHYTASYVITAGALENSGAKVSATVQTSAGISATATSVASAPLDNKAPTVTIGSAGGADAVVSAQSGDNVITGTGEANRSVTLKSGTTTLGTATADGSGNWSFTLGSSELTALGQGAKSLVATQSDAAGNSGSSGSFSFSVDTVVPAVQSLVTDSATRTVRITFGESLDTAHLPLASAFAVSTGGSSNPVSSLSASGAVLTLVLQNAFGSGTASSVTYTVPTAPGANLIRDAAGNPSAGFTSGAVADGYVRGASVYIDTNGSGGVDAGDYYVGTTNADGNFFLPEGAPAGSVIARGGVNIDTGVPNTLVLQAPAGSLTVNPLTTLVQAVAVAQGGTIDQAAIDAASAKVASALGLDLGTASLANYDPLAAQDVGTQKVAAQIAVAVALVTSVDATQANTVMNNLVTLVQTAATSASSISLSDSGTLSAVLSQTAASTDTTVSSVIETAVASLAEATSLSNIVTVQQQVLDTVAPVMTRLDGPAIAATASPVLRANFNITATDGTAVVAGDTLLLREGAATLATFTLGTQDIQAGHRDITSLSLADGVHALSASLVDAAGNAGGALGLTVMIDTVAPDAPVIALVAGDDVINGAEPGAVLSGTAEAGATVSLALGAGNTRSVVADGTGAWSYALTAPDITALGQGAKTLFATATDAAGNTGAAGSRGVFIDTVAPEMSVGIVSVSDNVAPGIGPVSSGSITNDNTLDLAGSMSAAPAAGESVVVYDGAQRLGVATVSGTSWTFTTPALSNGGHSFSARVEDMAGNNGAFSGSFALEVNAAVPTATANITGAQDDVPAVLGAVANGGWTNDSTPTLSGSLSGSLAAGDVVVVYDGATRLGVAAVSGSAWTFTPAALAAGAHTFSAVVESSGGNQSAPGTGYSLNVDLAAPAAPSINTVAGDNMINAAEQTSVISGLAEANATITLGLGSAQRTATAGADGVWRYTLTAADISAMGQGTMAITATATDAAGNTSTAGTRSLSVDTLPPAPPTINTVAGDNIINAAEEAAGVTVSGTTEAGSRVTLNGRAAAVSGTTWSLNFTLADLTAMGDGARTLTAVATDAAGNTSSASRNFLIDSIAPVAGAISLANFQDTGTAGDRISSDNTFDLVLSGNEAGSTAVFQQRLNGGAWSDLSGAALSSIADGQYDFRARVTDAAGNASFSAFTRVVIATGGPAVAVGSSIGTDTGRVASIASGGITCDNTLALSGTASDVNGIAGVEVFDGATSLGLAALSGGTWTLTTGVLAEGAHSFTARATNGVGVTSTSAAVTAIVDRSAPTPGTLAFSGLDDTGTANTPAITTDNVFSLSLSGNSDTNGTSVTYQVSTDGTNWSSTTASQSGLTDGNYRFRAIVTDPAGNSATSNVVSVIVDNTAPTPGTLAFSGLDDTGSANTPAITSDNVFSLSLSGNSDANGTSVTYQVSTDGTNWSSTTASQSGLTDGNYRFRAIVTDPAGNSATSNVVNVIVDKTAPAVTIANAIGTDSGITGTIVGGGATQDTTLAVSGTASDANGVTQVEVYDGSTRLGTAELVGGTWSFTSAALAEGLHALTAVATDKAGNTATSGALNATVDRTAPALTINTTLGTDTGETGTVSSGGVTRDSTIALSGTVSDSNGVASVKIFDGTTLLGTASVNAVAGTWSYTTPVLADALHSLVAVATDPAGNTSTTGVVTVTINTVPVVNAGGDAYINAAEAGALAGLTVKSPGITGVTITQGSVSTTAAWDAAASLYRFDTGLFEDGTLVVTVAQTDATGQPSSHDAGITLDRHAPAIVSVAVMPDRSGAWLLFDEPLAGTPSASGFSASVDSQPVAIDAATVSASADATGLYIGFAAPLAAGKTVQVGYMSGIASGTLHDAAGNAVASFGAGVAVPVPVADFPVVDGWNIGASGSDLVAAVANPLAQNRFDGGGGNDRLLGLGQGDTFIGGADEDSVLVRPDAIWVDEGLPSAHLAIGFYNADFAAALTNDRSDASAPFFSFGGNLAFAQAERIDVADANGAIDRSFTLQPDGQALLLSPKADIVVLTPGPSRVDGGAGDDTLIGTSGADVLHGGAGDDVLSAGVPGLSMGTDYSELFGDDGNDLLVALSGHVRATGGAGSDVFAVDGGSAVDMVIADFVRGLDKIDLSRVLEAAQVQSLIASSAADTVNGGHLSSFSGTAAGQAVSITVHSDAGLTAGDFIADPRGWHERLDALLGVPV